MTTHNLPSLPDRDPYTCNNAKGMAEPRLLPWSNCLWGVLCSCSEGGNAALPCALLRRVRFPRSVHARPTSKFDLIDAHLSVAMRRKTINVTVCPHPLYLTRSLPRLIHFHHPVRPRAGATPRGPRAMARQMTRLRSRRVSTNSMGKMDQRQHPQCTSLLAREFLCVRVCACVRASEWVSD